MRKGSKKKKENTITIKIILVIDLIDLYENSPPQTMNSFNSLFLVFT